MAPAISNGEAILIIVLATIPIGALTFALGAAGAFRQIGKGPLAVEFERDAPGQGLHPAPPPQAREGEIRQLLEAKAYRQRSRGEPPLDVEAELRRLLAEERPASKAAGEPQLRAEVRQLVEARNERRMRQGKEPLDVDAEIERELQELEGLGQ